MTCSPSICLRGFTLDTATKSICTARFRRARGWDRGEEPRPFWSPDILGMTLDCPHDMEDDRDNERSTAPIVTPKPYLRSTPYTNPLSPTPTDLRGPTLGWVPQILPTTSLAHGKLSVSHLSSTHSHTAIHHQIIPDCSSHTTTSLPTTSKPTLGTQSTATRQPTTALGAEEKRGKDSQHAQPPKVVRLPRSGEMCGGAERT
ncbi:hypothetical protein B0T25DRAFT_221931 [Lasiosphaeria hispida]|uniref:Uncharacterized protein n=1 Tax=Lasiosphaeria hispida TaxID=260671 RepID=A0AAJ0HJT6_9PEZI|nr:hypothetical protein B0T25DRAFT_221931 [Lasiosphaeria hispida]